MSGRWLLSPLQHLPFVYLHCRRAGILQGMYRVLKEGRAMGKSISGIWKANRKDCSQCKFEQACGDIFPVEGKCPANNGGETWARFEEKGKGK